MPNVQSPVMLVTWLTATCGVLAGAAVTLVNVTSLGKSFFGFFDLCKRQTEEGGWPSVIEAAMTTSAEGLAAASPSPTALSSCPSSSSSLKDRIRLKVLLTCAAAAAVGVGPSMSNGSLEMVLF